MPYKNIIERRKASVRWKKKHPVNVAAQMKRHRQKHSIQLNAYNKKWREEHSDYANKWRNCNKDKTKIYTMNYEQRLHAAIFDILGDKCVTCGFSDKRALQIDHIGGDGAEDRRMGRGKYYRRVLDSAIKREGKYQILCSNCNWIKRAENNETYPMSKRPLKEIYYG